MKSSGLVRGSDRRARIADVTFWRSRTLSPCREGQVAMKCHASSHGAEQSLHEGSAGERWRGGCSCSEAGSILLQTLTAG